MFQLISQQAKTATCRRILVQTSQQNANGIYQIPQQPFNSIFGNIFNKKKPEEKKEQPVKQQGKQVPVEPTKYHKETVKAVQENGDDEDIKQHIRKLDRSGQNNLFGKYQRVRKTLKEKNSNLEDHLHPSLLSSGRVTIEKFENNKFKRGLGAEETAFPISPKVGPYIVDKPIFGAKNYFYCSCGLSQNQPFCDSSHKGTHFKPVKFSLDEKSERLHLCGCKLSTQAPFCDGATCKKILSGEQFTEAQAALSEHEASAVNTQNEQQK